jgi:hypothetical protein
VSTLRDDRSALDDLQAQSPGVPYFVTRVVPALYHVILLPADRSDSDLLTFAQAQTHANRLDGCLVLAESRAVYVGVDNCVKESDIPPIGGVLVSGYLAPAIAFDDSDELRLRRAQLDAVADASRLTSRMPVRRSH